MTSLGLDQPLSSPVSFTPMKRGQRTLKGKPGHHVDRVGAADADGDHAQAAGVGGVAVGADHHAAGEGVVLEHHLVDDAGARLPEADAVLGRHDSRKSYTSALFSSVGQVLDLGADLGLDEVVAVHGGGHGHLVGSPAVMNCSSAIWAVASCIGHAVGVGSESSLYNVVVMDVPLLTESGMDGLAGVVVVDVDPEVAIARLVKHRGFDEVDARNRVAAQASREDRRKLADWVIDNSGDQASLVVAIDELWADIHGRHSGGERSDATLRYGSRP
jgi:hypothetical protein